MSNLDNRFQQCRRSLWKDIRRGPFVSGTELLGWFKLHDGRHVQLQLIMTTEESRFIDVDAPTGCGDHLACGEDF